MNASKLPVFGLLVFGLCLSPVVLTAQTKEQLQSIQRDVAQVQEQVKELQTSQDAKMAALQTALQQTADASSKVAAGLTALQHSVDMKLTEQQNKLEEPVATMGTKVDAMSDTFQSMATNIAELVRRMDKLDARLDDISNAVRTLSAPPAAPPGTPSAATTPGVSAETSYENAYRDYQGGQKDLALMEFNDFVKNFPASEYAPTAEYYIGYIYYNGAQYDDAAKAFDAVLERFPSNSKTQDAFYYKALSLLKAGHRTEAGAEFKEFIKSYPSNEHVPQAHANLRALGLEHSTAKKRD